ncbi:hybrid sensor histidine kinase/response regulator [Pseudomonas mangrovi]|uniref:histidine kinase n=1 Tax=Pseudomonas mangrovi TaxID=2161748 RepID=A0A2T5PDG9_9PSED|nr:PAS domain-containing sensor histidine kinase [Pseudomonas mangrovi]PTU75775.1 hybrid sensor histidine kinase/response regulator [Pseudomonas mangrovi]
MTDEPRFQPTTLLVAAPFKGDAVCLSRLLGDKYPVQTYEDASTLASAIDSQTGLLILTEEALQRNTGALGTALDEQPAWSEIPVILLSSNQRRSGRDTELARRRLPDSAGHVVVLERPLSSASLLSAVAAAWRSRQRQFEMRDRLVELAEERGRLQTLLENIPVGVCFMDDQGQPLVTNPLYVQYTSGGVIPSRQPDRAAAWTGYDAHGNRLEPQMFPAARALRGEPATGIDFCHDQGDGSQSWMRVSAVPLYGGSRQVIGAAAVIVDINEEKLAELSLRRFNEELEIQVQARTRELNAVVQQLRTESEERARAEEQLRQSLKMEAVGQLTGGIAHDFNNMLTGVISALDLIKLRIANQRTDGVDRLMDAALSSAGRAASLTQRLLAFSRRQSLDAKPLEVNRLVLTLRDLLERTLTEQIVLRLDLSAEEPWVCADANQLENALLNLALNARDAMPHGGNLTISTRLQRSAVGADAGEVCIEVRDSGCGIAQNLLSRVTEPFFTTKPIGQGTGLGLSMVYGFARQSSGVLTIDSAPNAGTSVSIRLPQAVQVSSAAQAAQELLVPGKGQPILLVEDDDSVRLINQELLQELGYQVVVARDGEEALDYFRRLEDIELLVTDVGLPGMNGRQLAEVVQQLKPQLPVLFLTGYAEGAMSRADFLGPNMQLLTKPFALDVLATRVADMLGATDQAKAASRPGRLN